MRGLVNKRPFLTIGTICIVIGLVVGMLVLNRRYNQPTRARVITKAFFTSDDGATLFADDISKIPPFEHDGLEAVRAYVFSCDGGKHQWIQYLEKLDLAAKTRLAAYDPVKTGKSPGRLTPLIKKPGTGAWISAADPKATDLMEPHCPDGMGTGAIVPVLP